MGGEGRYEKMVKRTPGLADGRGDLKMAGRV